MNISFSYINAGLLYYIMIFPIILMQLYILTNCVSYLTNYYKSHFRDNFSHFSLLENKKSENLKTITLFFETNKNLYLKNDFTINSLSKNVNIPVHKISHTINKELNINFLTFLAFYRIQHSKEIILNNPYYKLEAIVNECGFNSRTTFIKYFKKFENCTLTEYRNRLDKQEILKKHLIIKKKLKVVYKQKD